MTSTHRVYTNPKYSRCIHMNYEVGQVLVRSRGERRSRRDVLRVPRTPRSRASGLVGRDVPPMRPTVQRRGEGVTVCLHAKKRRLYKRGSKREFLPYGWECRECGERFK